MSISGQLIEATQLLTQSLESFEAVDPVRFVYHPLIYAWPIHEAYIQQYGATKKRVIFLGINPGPFGMAQTGIPFGEVAAVKNWLHLAGAIAKPQLECPSRPVQGWACHRSEVSGRRLWGLFQDRFQTADRFFADHYVVNYCPLLFLEQNGRNFTPDKFPKKLQDLLFDACDQYLENLVHILQPEWVIGIGGLMGKRCQSLFEGSKVRYGHILHPSPANPQANGGGWTQKVTQQMLDMGAW